LYTLIYFSFNVAMLTIGSSLNLESLAYKLDNPPRRVRLTQLRHLARNIVGSMVVSAGIHQVAAELKTNEDGEVCDFG